MSTNGSGDSVRQFVRDWISRHAKKAIRNGELDDTTNFVATGMIDSMSFVRLLMDTEVEYGIQLDFSELDPGEFLSIDGFATCVCACLHASPKP